MNTSGKTCVSQAQFLNRIYTRLKEPIVSGFDRSTKNRGDFVVYSAKNLFAPFMVKDGVTGSRGRIFADDSSPNQEEKAMEIC